MKSPFLLAHITGEVTREFGITNRAQSHSWCNGKGSRKAHAASKQAALALGCPTPDTQKRNDNSTRHKSSQRDYEASRAISSISPITTKKGKESFFGHVTELVPTQAGTHA
jgi:hypothetical protein